MLLIAPCFHLLCSCEQMYSQSSSYSVTHLCTQSDVSVPTVPLSCAPPVPLWSAWPWLPFPGASLVLSSLHLAFLCIVSCLAFVRILKKVYEEYLLETVSLRMALFYSHTWMLVGTRFLSEFGRYLIDVFKLPMLASWFCFFACELSPRLCTHRNLSVLPFLSL